MTTMTTMTPVPPPIAFEEAVYVFIEHRTTGLFTALFSNISSHGFIIVREGVFTNAVFGHLRGREALYAIAENPTCRLKSLPWPRHKDLPCDFELPVSQFVASRNGGTEEIPLAEPVESDVPEQGMNEGAEEIPLAEPVEDDVPEQGAPLTPEQSAEAGKDDAGNGSNDESSLNGMEPDTFISAKDAEEGAFRMSDVNKILEGILEVEGAVAVAVISTQGEVLANASKAGVSIDEICAIASEVFTQSAKGAMLLNVGSAVCIHMETTEANAFIRNVPDGRNTDFLRLVALFGKNANIGLAKLRLARVATDLLPFFR